MSAASLRRGRWTRAAWISAAAIIALGVAAANAHLVYVALTSETGCVPHDKTADDTTRMLRAAKSGC